MLKSLLPDWSKPGNWSLKFRLTTLIILLVGLTLLSFTWVTIQIERSNRIQQANEGFKTEADNLHNLVEFYLVGWVNQLQVLTISDIIEDATIERNNSYRGSQSDIIAQIQALDAAWVDAPDNDPLILRITSNDEKVNPAGPQLRDLVKHTQEHAELFITDRFGATIAATDRLSDYYQADEAWWQAAWNQGEGAVFISEPVFDQSTGVVGLQIALPIYNEETQELIGILRSTLNAQGLFDLVNSISFGNTGHARLLNRSGELIWSGQRASQPVLGAEDRVTEHLQPVLDTNTTSGFVRIFDSQGTEWLAGYAKSNDLVNFRSEALETIGQLDWTIVILQTTDEALFSLTQAVWRNLIIGFTVLVLAAVAALFLARTVTNPLVRLSLAAEQLGQGQLNTPLPSPGRDEIGRLAGSFNNMAAQLRGLIERVANRTRLLENLVNVSERVSAILRLEPLFAEAVNQIQKQFGYYQVHIYLLDQTGQRLVLAEGTGVAGATMKENNHQIAVDTSTTLVARAYRSGQMVWVDNVHEDNSWLPNSLLPDISAEIAIPIILDGQIIGVLNVQDDKVRNFDESETSVLRSLATQIAVAIRNARAFTETQTVLEETIAVQKQYTTQVWERTKYQPAYDYQRAGSSTLDEITLTRLHQLAKEQPQPALITTSVNLDVEPETTDYVALVAPIKLQDQTIGTIQFYETKNPDQKRWGDQEVTFVEVVMDQVAQTAESLRLFDETRERASREQTIREITEKMRAAPNIERLVAIATEELGRRLAATHAELELGVDSKDEAV